MNVALATIVIFIIFSPGIVFRRSYLSLPFSRKFNQTSLIDDISWSVIPAFIIHAIGIWYINNKTQFSVDFSVYEDLLLGRKNVNGGASATSLTSFEKIQYFLPQILQYHFYIFAFSFTGGHITRKLVIYFKLDRCFRFLRFSNEWYYLFSGGILDFGNIEGKSDNIKTIYIDLLKSTNEGHIIYTGILAEYNMAAGGGLDSICLSNVSRKELKNNKVGIEKAIPGKFVVFPYSSVVNINVRYITVEKNGKYKILEYLKRTNRWFRNTPMGILSFLKKIFTE